MGSTVEYRVGATDSGAAGITPLVDGRELTDLITEFEAERGWEPAGGYGPLIPAHFNFGDLKSYFVGLNEHQWPGSGQAWLLGCECGEVGCWPLEARVHIDSRTVTWTDFAQPFRRERDYTGFGPFTFDRAQYEKSVEAAVEALSN
jgi:hypothetical protein